MSAITVFCGSSLGGRDGFGVAASDLGRAIGEAGHTLIYGGANIGLMGLVADAALAAGAHVVGVMPRRMTEREIQHPGLTETIITDSMHERKAIMASRAEGFIALPGGYGTLDETMEVLTWNQIGDISKPVVFLDVDGFYSSLFRFLDDAVHAGLLQSGHRACAQRVTTVDDAIARATAGAPPIPSKWVGLTQ